MKKIFILSAVALAILFAGIVNAQQPAVPIEINGHNAVPYNYDLNYWTDQWRAPQAIYDRGIYQDDPDNWYQTASGEGSTWYINGSTPQYGILVVDMNQVRTLNKFSVFQMFSDGKTTGIQIFKNTGFTGDTPPLSSDAGWVEVTSGVTPVGAGTNNTTYISDPAQITVPDFTSRYIMIYAHLDVSLGYSYIELKGIKGFYYNGSSYSINYLRGGPPVWNSGGSGTLADPYRVNNLDDLKYLSKWFGDFRNSYFKQTADIDASATSSWNGGAGWSPIGTMTNSFNGTYDGNGLTISNLFINRPTTDFVGFIGVTRKELGDDPAAVKNLGVINANVTGKSYVGGLAGLIVRGIVTNCYSTGSVTGTNYAIGGLCGSSSNYASDGKVSGCYSECNVTGYMEVGGLIGDHDGKLENSHSSGTVNGYQMIGGLVGRFFRGSIKQCHSVSDASSSGYGGGYVGGLAGYFQGYATGDILQDSYSMGSATGPTHCGGLVGYFIAGAIDKCYSIGLVTGTTNHGGLVGLSDNPSAVTASFWDREKSGQDASSGGILKFTSEMKTQSTFTDAGWDFTSPVWGMHNLINVGYAYLAEDSPPANYTWTGAGSTNWNNAANWDAGVVPMSNSNVTIPNVTNKPLVNQDPGTPAVCHNLTIQSGAALTISSGKALTVTGSLNNSAGATGLIVKSGGSLITPGSVSGIATVERSIAGGEWHLISSPVSGAVSGMFTGKYLQQHAESTNAYTDITSPVEPLSPMKGFAIYNATTFPAQFVGALNTNYQIINTYNSGVDKGWNLVGNPYPSSIDWDAPSGWTRSAVDNAIYIHKDAATWASYVYDEPSHLMVGTNGGSRFIGPCQGFFVRTATNGILGMNNDVRVHNSTPFFKHSGGTMNNLVRLEVSGNDYTDEAVVMFQPDATAEFDSRFDAYKIFGDVPECAQIYTLGSTPLAINILPETNQIPVGIHAGASGTYTVKATEINDMKYIILEDTKTGIYTDLAKGPYIFTMEAGENEQRFNLRFSLVGIVDPGKAFNNIYSCDKTVIVNLDAGTSGDVYIYNVAGQIVASRVATTGQMRIYLDNTGVYLVKIVTEKETSSKKVWIR